MRISISCMLLALTGHSLSRTSEAFSPNPIGHISASKSSSRIGSTYGNYGMSNVEDEATVRAKTADETIGVRVQPGTVDELFYALGVNLARQLGDVRPLVESGDELAHVAKGLLDTVVGRLNDDGQTEILRRRGKELNEIIASRANAIRVKLEQDGRDMLQNMAQSPNVIVLETGVVVDVLDQGTGSGARATPSSTVLIHYHGTLADGTVFDSTLQGEPVKFPLAQVVPGWRDGVLMMTEGQTAMIGIPPEQAYGNHGTPDGRVPGGSTLFFKVTLVQILSAAIGGNQSNLYDGSGNQMGQQQGSGLMGPDGRPLN